MPVIPLPPNAPHQTMGHSYPNSSIPMPPKLSFPTSQQLHCFRHNLVNAKQSKYHKPQIKSNRAMDKEVWSIDSPFLLHIQLPIQNQNLSFPKIINSQYSSKLQSKQKKQLQKGPQTSKQSSKEKTNRNFLSEPSNKNEQQNLFPQQVSNTFYHPQLLSKKLHKFQTLNCKRIPILNLHYIF